MPEKIQVQYSTSAVTLYAVIRDSAGLVWNGSAFGTYATASLSTYAVLLAEQGTASRYYTATVPAGITTAGRYAFVIFQKLGGSYAETDTVVSGGAIDWDGIAIAGSASTTLKVGSAVVVTDLNSASVNEIVDGVWDEPTASHTGIGTFGLAAGTAATAANIWSYSPRTLSGGVTIDFTQSYPASPTAGSTGQCFNFIGTRLDATITSRGTGDATATAVGNVQTDVTTLLSRLTSTRAGYIDNLSSAPPSSSTIATAVWDKDISGVSTANYAGTVLNAKSTTTALAAAQTDITTLLGRLTSTRAGYLDNLATAPPTAATIATAVWDLSLIHI